MSKRLSSSKFARVVLDFEFCRISKTAYQQAFSVLLELHVSPGLVVVAHPEHAEEAEDDEVEHDAEAEVCWTVLVSAGTSVTRVEGASLTRVEGASLTRVEGATVKAQA
eukprot:2529916-Rhodomonas_salina.2